MRNILCLFIYLFMYFPSVADDQQDCLKGKNIHSRMAACNRSLSSNNVEAYQRAHLLNARGDLHVNSRQYQQAILDYQAAQRQMKKADHSGREKQVELFLFITNFNTAYSYCTLGQLKKAEKQRLQLLIHARRMKSQSHIHRALDLQRYVQKLQSHRAATNRRTYQAKQSVIPRKAKERPANIQNTASIQSPKHYSGFTRFFSFLALFLLLGLLYFAFRKRSNRFNFVSSYLQQINTARHDYSETVMSKTKSTVLEAFAPTETKNTVHPVDTTGGIPAQFDLSNMQLHLRREQKRGLSGAVTYTLHLFVEMSDDAKQAIKHYGFGNEIIYTKKTVVDPGSRWAIINPWKWVMHLFWWFLTRKLHTVRVSELVAGKTLKCKNIIEMVEIEDQIFAAMKNFGRIMYTAAHFGGEETFDIDQEIGVKQRLSA